MKDSTQKWTPYLLSVLRIVVGGLFLEHGTAKFFSFPNAGISGMPMFSLAWFSGALELLGGAMILIGLFTRPVAFILAGEMAVAYFMVHAPKSFFPLINGGEAAVFYCFIFLYMAAAGGGAWAFDRSIWRR